MKKRNKKVVSRHKKELGLGPLLAMSVVFHVVVFGVFALMPTSGKADTNVKKALMFNFLTALTSVLGAAFALTVGASIPNFIEYALPFTAGGFIYIAGSDLIPELHKQIGGGKSLVQFIALAAGMGVMLLLTLIG